MIKAFIFDFGGVLMRTEDYSARQTWDAKLGLPPGSVERAIHYSDLWVQTQLGRVTDDAYWIGVAEMLRMRPAEIPALRDAYFSGDRLNYKVVNLIRELRESGYKLALLSNDSLQLEDKLRALEIFDLFDHILISAKIGVMKPDVTAYRVALQALKESPLETVYVDESLLNIRGAQPLGLRTILFRPEIDLRAEIARYLDDSNKGSP
jgi:putative hydrolase of the HAD superfamily